MATCNTSGGPKDFNLVDCTQDTTDYNASKQCWTTTPTIAPRTVTCYAVATDGTLTKAEDDSACANVPVFLTDGTMTKPTNPCNTGTPNDTTKGNTVVPAGGCLFAGTAGSIGEVASTETCTGCQLCPTYAIGVGPFTFA